jgi:hypothetical protein
MEPLQSQESYRHTTIYETAAGRLGTKTDTGVFDDSHAYTTPEDTAIAQIVELQTWKHYLDEVDGDEFGTSAADWVDDDDTEMAAKQKAKSTIKVRFHSHVSYQYN